MSKQETVEEKLLARGREILSDVDQFLAVQCLPPNEQCPSFLRNELEFGKVLGIGTFGVVCEINRIELFHPEEDLWSNSSDAETEITTDGRGVTEMDGLHNGIAAVRDLIAQRCTRYGEARYAVKRVNDNLYGFDAVAGRVDLAVEVKLLHALSHPNIVKMRGVFNTDDPFHPSFFFVMDRLYGTLEDRIQEQKQKQESRWGRVLRSLFFLKRCSADLSMSSKIERLVVAYDIASALRYLHSHNLVYRDMKPENVGFDVRGNVKVFDFGLARPLDPKLRNAQGMYHLTARTGSIPYMAPEVAMMEPYNEKSDVFSYGILLWELLSLDQAFISVVHSSADYYQHVVENQMRPRMARKWPPMVKCVMQSAWNQSPQLRPSMINVCAMLQAQLVSMTTDEKVRGRTLHMLDQSAKSICLSK